MAASLQAPTLFTLAADLAEMQVKTNIDESDLGNIRNGQLVTFRVDAYPTRTFRGTVTQVRLDPVVVQNVVTYAAIISAPNAGLELKPGMTANVTIEWPPRMTCCGSPLRRCGFAPLRARDGAGAGFTVLATAPSGTGAAGAARGRAGTVMDVRRKLQAVPVTTGVTDGVYTEITADALHEGLLRATA